MVSPWSVGPPPSCVSQGTLMIGWVVSNILKECKGQHTKQQCHIPEDVNLQQHCCENLNLTCVYDTETVERDGKGENIMDLIQFPFVYSLTFENVRGDLRPLTFCASQKHTHCRAS
jgi:hypothetical protein